MTAAANPAAAAKSALSGATGFVKGTLGFIFSKKTLIIGGLAIGACALAMAFNPAAAIAAPGATEAVLTTMKSQFAHAGSAAWEAASSFAAGSWTAISSGAPDIFGYIKDGAVSGYNAISAAAANGAVPAVS